MFYTGVKKMNNKIFIILFFLFALISVSAVSAADADGNNDTIVSSANAEILSAANDVNAIDDLNRDYSDSEAVLENAVKSSAAGEKEILGVENSGSDVVGATGTRITSVNVFIDRNGALDVSGGMRDSNDGVIDKGTISVCLNDRVYATLDPGGALGFSTKVMLTPGSYNLVLRYHDDSGDYEDCEYVYENNPIVKEPPTWYVDGSKSSSGNGKNEANAFVTLAEALTAANDGDKIKIAAGTYTGSGNIGLTVEKILTFEKYGDGEAIFDGNGQSTIWSVGANSINISGLTFKNGHSNMGGAIYFLDDVSNSVINATFINNTADDFGGAIYIKYRVSNLILNSAFINNTAAFLGGAIFIEDEISNVNISGKFINNTGYNVIYIESTYGNNYIQDSVFLNNNVNNQIILVDMGQITAKDNWFGNNYTNYDVMPEKVGIDLDNWLFLNYTINTHKLDVGDNSQISFILVSFSGSGVSDYDASKMNITLDLSQTLGELDKTSALMGETITYTAKKGGDATVKILLLQVM